MSLLERYEGGDHLAVYAELVKNPGHAEAEAVARSLMKRVRKNLETLATRWRERGFTLRNPIGNAGSQAEALAALGETIGPLPPTLRAFYEEIGWVDFVEEPPDDLWPDVEHL